jgi:hypothetical protein
VSHDTVGSTAPFGAVGATVEFSTVGSLVMTFSTVSDETVGFSTPEPKVSLHFCVAEGQDDDSVDIGLVPGKFFRHPV